MSTGTKFLAIAAVIVLAVMLQAVLILTENRETPAKAAVVFARAYFNQDASLADLLCSELRTDQEGDVVAAYINRVADDAAATGFAPSWMKMSPGHIETETRMTGADSAEVTLKASLRRNINPLYAIVARVFFLGESYPFEGSLNLVKEDQRWKVCGRPFALIKG
jgi:hypothetical protein